MRPPEDGRVSPVGPRTFPALINAVKERLPSHLTNSAPLLKSVFSLVLLLELLF
jgi:hypothetical protein